MRGGAVRLSSFLKIMKNVYVYVYPIEDFERNIPDNELIKAYRDGSVKRYSLDEFAELINDEGFDEVNNWVRIIDDMAGYFPISYLHRDDLEGIGYDVREVSDWDMEAITEKLGEDYTEQLFHSSLPIIAEHVGVPKTLIACSDEYRNMQLPDGMSKTNQ